VKGDTTEERWAIPPSIAARYETLRSAALGEPLAPEARSGLGLFLRRGLWGWARVLAVSGEPGPPTRPPAVSSTAPDHHKAVIQVFAAMAVNTNPRTTP